MFQIYGRIARIVTKALFPSSSIKPLSRSIAAREALITTFELNLLKGDR